MPKHLLIPATCRGCENRVWLAFEDSLPGKPVQGAYWTCMHCFTTITLGVIGWIVAVRTRQNAE